MRVAPLISHGAPEAIVAYRDGKAVHAARFLADVAHVAAHMPAASHVLNACKDRYSFTVGLAACISSGRVSLLPSTHTPETIRQLQEFAPDAICLTDDGNCNVDLPLCQFPRGAPSVAAVWPPPAIPVDRRVAFIFTSGSTGLPVPHAKTWGRLLRCVQIATARLRLKKNAGHAIVGTVPPQHMYGFESTVLLPLQSGNALCAERPFYPADISSTLAAVPAPRILVSTPVHLRTLVKGNVELPPIELVLCATAPLDESLAREVEARFGAPLLEIYGSTETGQIASRRTTQSVEWLLWPGVHVTVRDERTWVEGGHVEAATPMGDVLELVGSDRFLLRGRLADMVNIAGKRSSMAYLNHQLTSIPGVVDGAFFLPEEGTPAANGVTRLGALAVAPGLTADAITKLLRERLDPAFLPRPLLLVPEIQRNATGKLPMHVLRALLAGA